MNKTEQTKWQKRKNILLDGCYFIQGAGICKKKATVYILKTCREIGQSFEESVRGGKKKYFEWIIKQLLNSAFMWCEEFCRSRTDVIHIGMKHWWITSPLICIILHIVLNVIHTIIAKYLFYLFTGKYCGKTPPGLIKASAQSLFIMFHSDDLVVSKGFRAEWSSRSSTVTSGAKGKLLEALFMWSRLETC